MSPSLLDTDSPRETGRSPGVLALDDATATAVDAVARALLPVAGGAVDAPGWSAAARRLWHELPTALRRALADFRRDPGPGGALLLRGLLVHEAGVPATPAVSGSVQRHATLPASVLALVAHALGDMIAYRSEKAGALVHDVVPVPGSEEFQGNEGSVLLTFHNENAFDIHRPDYVLLFCLRADHERVAGLRTASIRQVRGLLDERHREALFRADFVTAPPPSFGAGRGGSLRHAVLSGAWDDPDVLVDFAATSAVTPGGAEAMRALQELFAAHADTRLLVPGDLAIVDNRLTVHGRTAFAPRYDGLDRWLQRAFVARDLRASRARRAGDGQVLADLTP
ncbi:TauD/TfdA family dioxygenase [Streptomyces sedi]|uniref:L-asparagine oxygenase n=1 Tax=Streptomyces sedi TaxID=555059 RepID=A0A5C4UY38_9ACTN|nr:TauD/TfdA family dioxygenase [Streptomyces sedi]TNM28143.1 L-asparagine oxygenase [Streptomyces sedi]